MERERAETHIGFGGHYDLKLKIKPLENKVHADKFEAVSLLKEKDLIEPDPITDPKSFLPSNTFDPDSNYEGQEPIFAKVEHFHQALTSLLKLSLESGNDDNNQVMIDYTNQEQQIDTSKTNLKFQSNLKKISERQPEYFKRVFYPKVRPLQITGDAKFLLEINKSLPISEDPLLKPTKPISPKRSNRSKQQSYTKNSPRIIKTKTKPENAIKLMENPFKEEPKKDDDSNENLDLKFDPQVSHQL